MHGDEVNGDDIDAMVGARVTTLFASVGIRK